MRQYQHRGLRTWVRISQNNGRNHIGVTSRLPENPVGPLRAGYKHVLPTAVRPASAQLIGGLMRFGNKFAVANTTFPVAICGRTHTLASNYALKGDMLV